MKKLIGNAIIGQSGGPTVAINATLAGVIKACRFEEPTNVLYGMRNGVEGLLKEDFVNLTEFFSTKEKLSILMQTPAAVLGSCRKKLPPPEEDETIYVRLFEIFNRYNIHTFFYIGGNDSMDTVSKISTYVKKHNLDFQAIGIPKTIDNDLVNTDHTPGYGSAAKYVAITTQEIIQDCAVYTIPAVTIVEIMGRNAGWLTAASALGSVSSGLKPDYIYLPEQPFTIARYLEDVKKAFQKHPNVVIAVSEGIQIDEQDNDASYLEKDAFGHTILAGIGKTLAKITKKAFSCKTRAVELNLPQRCAAHVASGTDIKEALMIGKYAVSLAIREKNGYMVTLKRKSDSPYEVVCSYAKASSVANEIRFLPAKYIYENEAYVTDAFFDYALPLIQKELPIQYENGVPKYIVL